ncbi:MAG: alkyl hydroperoxide reductase [Legionella sp. 40-6]|nr:carboxymuconolactone decarboxylase family protein [Legionella sp.]OJY35943.1 MAG: alkyl hydroperoxide reductase [Legionella sp. 40-6]
MAIEQLKQQIPEVAKDIRLNLGSLFNTIPSGLNPVQFFGIALAVAYTLKNRELLAALKEEGADFIDEALDTAAQLAAALMAMNNVYYRAIHLAEDKELSHMPANLRMNGLANPGVAKLDFELFALAVSAINGCGMCIKAHIHQAKIGGISDAGIQNVLRIAAILNATVFSLSQLLQGD